MPLKNTKRPRWLSYVLVFLIILFLWTSLAAAASPNRQTQITQFSPVPGLLLPGNTTFGITIGAIILVTIVITSAIVRKTKSS